MSNPTLRTLFPTILLACVTAAAGAVYSQPAQAGTTQCGWVYDNANCTWVWMCWSTGYTSQRGAIDRNGTQWGSCGDGWW
jgi:hypothetical protein